MANLLIENEAEGIFVSILSRFKTNNSDLMNKIRGAMDNILKFKEADQVSKILGTAKTNVKAFGENPSNL